MTTVADKNCVLQINVSLGGVGAGVEDGSAPSVSVSNLASNREIVVQPAISRRAVAQIAPSPWLRAPEVDVLRSDLPWLLNMFMHFSLERETGARSATPG
ncbi:MAG: hypothetical protein ACR2GP_04190 [Burkholderiaceae bacterium]